jgi:type IV fimbrial biogenesis protein FimT
VSQTADQTLTLTRLAAARGARGYSLVELIVVMTIVGVVIGIAVPSYKYVTNSNRVAAEINLLLGDMQYARSEAVKQGAPVSVCPGTATMPSGGTSTGSCLTSGASWKGGWFVFSDVNGNGAFDSPGDQVLKIQPAFTSTDTFVSSDSSVKVVTFNREGFTTSIPASDAVNGVPGVQFQLDVSNANQQWRRCLLISFAGVMQTFHGGNSPCP